MDNRQQAADLLQKQLQELTSLTDLNEEDSTFRLWRENGLTIFNQFFPEEKRWVDSFSDWSFIPHVIRYNNNEGITPEDLIAYKKGLASAEVTIKAALKKLELFGITPKPAPIQKSHKGVTVQIDNTLSNEQTLNLTVNFDQIIHIINSLEVTDEEKSTATSKITELKDEVSKDNPSWEKIKGILIWLINFSRDVFMQVLPYILEMYTKRG